MPKKHINEYAHDIVFAVALTITLFLGVKEDVPFIATAFAASAYLSFINPYSIYSRAYNIIISYITAAIYGLVLHRLLREELMTNNIIFIFGIFLTLTLFAETLTYLKAEHPPAAAVLISFAYTKATNEHIMIFLSFIILMVALDSLFEKLLEHKKEIVNVTEEEIHHIEKRIIDDIHSISAVTLHTTEPRSERGKKSLEKIRSLLTKKRDDKHA